MLVNKVRNYYHNHQLKFKKNFFTTDGYLWRLLVDIVNMIYRGMIYYFLVYLVTLRKKNKKRKPAINSDTEKLRIIPQRPNPAVNARR